MKKALGWLLGFWMLVLGFVPAPSWSVDRPLSPEVSVFAPASASPTAAQGCAAHAGCCHHAPEASFPAADQQQEPSPTYPQPQRPCSQPCCQGFSLMAMALPPVLPGPAHPFPLAAIYQRPSSEHAHGRRLPGGIFQPPQA
jgi:hypothetical protein